MAAGMVMETAITAGTKQTFEQRGSETRRAAAPGGFFVFDDEPLTVRARRRSGWEGR